MIFLPGEILPSFKMDKIYSFFFDFLSEIYLLFRRVINDVYLCAKVIENFKFRIAYPQRRHNGHVIFHSCSIPPIIALIGLTHALFYLKKGND